MMWLDETASMLPVMNGSTATAHRPDALVARETGGLKVVVNADHPPFRSRESHGLVTDPASDVEHRSRAEPRTYLAVSRIVEGDEPGWGRLLEGSFTGLLHETSIIARL